MQGRAAVPAGQARRRREAIVQGVTRTRGCPRAGTSPVGQGWAPARTGGGGAEAEVSTSPWRMGDPSRALVKHDPAPVFPHARKSLNLQRRL